MNFTDAEVNKEFLNSPEPMSERYDKEKLKQKEEMKKKWLELFPEDKIYLICKYIEKLL